MTLNGFNAKIFSSGKNKTKKNWGETENTRETCINFEAVKAEFERKGIHLPTEADFVQLFLDDEIISLLLSYTNKYKVIYIL